MGKRARRAELLRRIIETQIEPQIAAAELRAEGINTDVTFVNVQPDATGHTVTCFGCGRTAKMAAAPPEGQIVMCPACNKRHHRR